MAETTTLRSPSRAQESLLKSIAAISKMSRSAQQRILPAITAQTQSRFLQTSSRRQRDSMGRKSRIKSFSQIAKPTAVAFVFLLVAAAVLLDVLDLLKEPIALIPYVGWLINIIVAVLKALLVGVPTFFMARRAQRISRGTAKIVEYGSALYREALIGFKRVTPMAKEMRKDSLLQKANPDTEMASLKQFVLYESRIILNQVIAQLLETIPLADLGPWQTIRVFRAYRDQQVEYRKARAVLITCRLLTDKLDTQAKIELAYLTLCLRLIQQLTIRASRRGVSGFAADAFDVARERVLRPPPVNPVEREKTSPAPSLRPQFAS